MARSKWKLANFNNFIWRRIFFFNKKKYFKKNRPFFYDRSCSIPNCFLNIYFRIYKGNMFRRLKINIYNVGYKFGEFSYTRKPFHFPLRKMNKRK